MSNKKQYDTDAQALEDLRVKIREIEWNADIAREAIRIAERYRTKADNQRIMLNQLQLGRLQGSDLISRQDAIDAVIAEGRSVDSRYLEAERIVHESDAVEALSMLPSADRPTRHTLPDGTKIPIDEESYEIGYTHGQMADRPTGWIPCSERLPIDSSNYLITVADLRLGHNGEHTVTIADFYAKAKKWNSIVDVVAWIPLPEPYKGGDNHE